ncbi:X-ray radiation resistance-associated protein 1 isoform X2 [Heptranchias perlo]|uniref:X-ray radiation resistance-associated protein 1 isoform X2 n=1 Tax=Heptranchias perlo TaxID=212740 RepID=UPI00355ACAB0
MRQHPECPFFIVMTFEGQYKLDNGAGVSTDCFPIRKTFKGGSQGAGHWVEIKKSTKQHQFQAVLCPKVFQSWSPEPSSPAKCCVRPPKPVKEKVLDGCYLMRLHCVDSQSDLCAVNISDQDLVSVKEEDFQAFDNVAYVNAAVNHLPFAFRQFPAIRELDLTVNGLRNLHITTKDFPHLEELNVSYNNLSKKDVLALGLLPHLKILHLTGNDLKSLPPDLTTPYDPLDWFHEPLPRFTALEVLMLDDNRLSDPCVFSSLANLHRLRYLNLDQNRFTGIPYLQQTEPSLSFKNSEGTQLCYSIINQFKQPINCPPANELENAEFQPVVEVHQPVIEVTEEEKKEKEKEEDFTDDISPLSSSINADAPTVEPPPLFQEQSNVEELLKPPPKKQMCFLKEKIEFLPPFSELRHLSLAKNKISDDEELLAVCLFPALNKLTIYENPVTFQSGKPQLVISMLQDKLEIEVICCKPRPPEKPPIIKVFNAKRKVDTHIPRIPKQPLMLETAKELLGPERPGEGGTQSGEAELESPRPVDDICTELMSALHMPCTTQVYTSEETPQTPDRQHEDAAKEKKVEGFFMTQVDDAMTSTGTQKAEDEETLGGKQAEASLVTDLPERYKGYEELLDAKTDPYFVEPIGIQQNVQQLERALRKLQLYPDPFATVNLQRGPYVSKERKLRKPAESTSWKSKADKMDAILKRMKEQRTLTVIPLAHVLRDRNTSQQQYNEAVGLLRELQLKYKEARERLASDMDRLHEECEIVSEIQELEVRPDSPTDRPGSSTDQG